MGAAYMMKFTCAIQILRGLNYFKAHISKWCDLRILGIEPKRLKTHYACDFGIEKPISKIKLKGWWHKIF
ncbi:hypothetical protein [uncultured Campylobacter sp.]|uniref:hypothetical protein n=1 Tax=uncultured Campylobacter sp. TaxID=218934 RepID=UPI002615CDC3|nr:hypothetical protein [uncultured Campylobacter sp.]